MTSSNENIFRVTGPLCGEFTSHRWIPLTKASDAELWCFLWFRLNKQLSKQSWRRWFETPPRSLWCHCNVSSCLPELTSILVVERYNPVIFLVWNPQIFIKNFRWVETSCQRTEWQWNAQHYSNNKPLLIIFTHKWNCVIHHSWVYIDPCTMGTSDVIFLYWIYAVRSAHVEMGHTIC